MEGKFESKILWVLFFMLIMLLNAEMLAAQTAAQCQEERRILVNACKSLITRSPPSAYCCERLRVTHFKCVCPMLTQVAAVIDVNYAIKVLQRCGRQVPRHFKCGSITTP